MKKTPLIVLGLTLLLAQGCGSSDNSETEDWTYGEPNSRDTTVRGQPYRSYYGLYYPLMGSMISPNSYQGATARDIGSPGFTPKRVGGFGGIGRGRSSYS